MFRHLFGVGESDVWDWPVDRWERHKAFADLWLEQNNVTLRIPEE